MAAIESIRRQTRSGIGTLWREDVAACLFLLPSVVPFVVFTAIPAVGAFALSFFRWDFVSPPVFVGWTNWLNFFSAGAALRSVAVTGLLLVIVVPISMALGMLLAIALDKIPFAKLFFRSIFFMPIVTSMVAISFVYNNMFATEAGVINYALGVLGVAPIAWLTYPITALLSISLMMIWSMTGLCMLVYLAGLQQIDGNLFEAARLDGANHWQLFRYVIRPLLGRSSQFLAITQSIHVLQTFEAVFVLTNGGPGDATTTIGLYIYKATFQQFDVGSAATASVALFAILLIVSLLQLRQYRRLSNA